MYFTLVLFFLFAIAISFLCSMLESVLLSITPSYAQLQQEQGVRLGAYLKSFKVDIDRPLAAILTLNTIAHTVGAIGVGEQASSIWSDSSPWITAFLVPALMTIAILILSEIIPKTLGANYWREMAPFTINTLVILILLLKPAVWLSEKITRILRKDGEGSVFSRSEFLAMAEIGARDGVIHQQESELIQSLLKFRSIQVKDVMTPRVVVRAVSKDMTVAEFLDAHGNISFSRIPIFEDSDSEKIVGYVRKDELFYAMVNDKSKSKLIEFSRDILVTLRGQPIPDLLNRFLEKREHISLVVDEFGGMDGIVTMEDVLETLLGLEIIDELDSVVDMQNLARKKWEKRASKLGLIESMEGQSE